MRVQRASFCYPGKTCGCMRNDYWMGVCLETIQLLDLRELSPYMSWRKEYIRRKNSCCNQREENITLIKFIMTSPRTTELVQAIAMLVTICCKLCLGRLQCTIWEAQNYRDCTCGTEFLDYEVHCQDSHTYYPPTSHQDTFYCDFHCENDGDLYDFGDDIYYCDCKHGTTGLCCEQGKRMCINNISYSRYQP